MNVYSIRMILGLSQSQLAKKIDVSVRQIRRWERQGDNAVMFAHNQRRIERLLPLKPSLSPVSAAGDGAESAG